jgi:hypothetical protein
VDSNDLSNKLWKRRALSPPQFVGTVAWEFSNHAELSEKCTELKTKKFNGGDIGDAGQTMLDALRLELRKESIRQDFIVAELALAPEVGRKLRLENAGPLCAHTSLQLTTLPHHDTSPVRQDGQRQYIPLSSELCLDEALMTGRQALMPRRIPAKERIEEWYQPPWRRSGDKDRASLILVSLYSSQISSILIVAHGSWKCKHVTLCHVKKKFHINYAANGALSQGKMYYRLSENWVAI